MLNTPNGKHIQRAFVIILTVFTSVIFLLMIKDYITTLILSMISAGLFYKLFQKITKFFKGRKSLGAGITVVIITLLFVIPIALFVTIVVEQANDISKDIVPQIQNELAKNNGQYELPEWVPARDFIIKNQNEIIDKLQEASSKLGNLVIGGVANFTQGALGMFLKLFIFVYSLFFFFIGGDKMTSSIRSFIPIDNSEFDKIINQGVSVTRATLKGALLIGVIQGSLVGFMFWILGIPGAAFWGAISIVLSIIPSIGSGIVWVPAVLILFLQGDSNKAIILLLWGALVVGLIDNLLRPKLVGRDAKMSDLMILLSTLGGLGFFGITGFILGPVVAGWTKTAWSIYHEHIIKEK